MSALKRADDALARLRKAEAEATEALRVATSELDQLLWLCAEYVVDNESSHHEQSCQCFSCRLRPFVSAERIAATWAVRR